MLDRTYVLARYWPYVHEREQLVPLQPNGRAPYTSAAAAIAAIDAFRDKGIGLPVTADVLVRAGVAESIAKRTLNSLIELELLDGDGRPTETFKGFKTVRSDAEYRVALEAWLHAVYADVLQYCDPSIDEPGRIQDGFRGFQPEGQRPAMASLLLGLWGYAGLPVAAERQQVSLERGNNRRSTPRKPKPSGPPKATEQTVAPQSTQSATPGVLFGITESDIAALSETDFADLWSALGKVARARGRKQADSSQSLPDEEEST